MLLFYIFLVSRTIRTILTHFTHIPSSRYNFTRLRFVSGAVFFFLLLLLGEIFDCKHLSF